MNDDEASLNDDDIRIGKMTLGKLTYKDDDCPWIFGDFAAGADFSSLVQYLVPDEDEAGRERLDFEALAKDGVFGDQIQWKCGGGSPTYLHCLTLSNQRREASWRCGGTPIDKVD